MISKKSLVPFLPLIALATGVVAQQLDPVSAGQVSGLTLTIARWNFAVAAPGPEWEWLQASIPGAADGTTFVCRHVETDARITVSVMDLDSRGMDVKRFSEGFVEGTSKKLASQGWTVSDAGATRSDFPSPGSMRFSSTARREDVTAYSRGYLIKEDRLYAVQEFTVDSVEAPALKAVAGSLRLLEPPAAYAPPPLAGVYIGLLVVVWGLCAIVNRFSGRPVVNGALAAGILIVLAALVFVGRSVGQLDAEQLGFRLGEPFFPLLFAALGARRFGKKKEEAQLLEARRRRPPPRRYEPRRPGRDRPGPGRSS